MTEPNDKQTDKPKKERVLHTRVPAVLDTELKRLAESLRVPVSNVVRAILMDAVEAADAVGQRAEGEIRHVAERLAMRRTRLRTESTEALRAGPPLASPSSATSGPQSATQESAPAPPTAEPAAPQTNPTPAAPLAGVLGFQPLMLARDTDCAVCGITLAAGSNAYLGITPTPGQATVVGPECLPFAHRPADVPPQGQGEST